MEDIETKKMTFARMYLEYENDTFAQIVNRNHLISIFDGKNIKEIEKNLRLFKMLEDETFLTTFTSFLPHYRSYLNEILERFILEAHQHGIIDYCYRQAYRVNDFSGLIVSDPKVLTMYMLSAGFYIWLGSIVIACIVFIYEQIRFTIEVYTTSE